MLGTVSCCNWIRILGTVLNVWNSKIWQKITTLCDINFYSSNCMESNFFELPSPDLLYRELFLRQDVTVSVMLLPLNCLWKCMWNIWSWKNILAYLSVLANHTYNYVQYNLNIWHKYKGDLFTPKWQTKYIYSYHFGNTSFFELQLSFPFYTWSWNFMASAQNVMCKFLASLLLPFLPP